MHSTHATIERLHKVTGTDRGVLRLYLEFNGGKTGGIVGQSALWALRLAKARVLTDTAGAVFVWRDEIERCDCEDTTPHTCESAALVIPCPDHGVDCRHTDYLASLGMICGADDSYRRLIEAELAFEAVDMLEAAIAAAEAAEAAADDSL